MKGDFTRNTFDPKKNFTRVLMQQGRVLLDSDWNEQADIQQHYLRKLAVDLIGPHAGPIGPNGETEGYPGFSITPKNDDLSIGLGSYYVDGIRCENKKDITYYGQLKLFKEKRPIPKVPYLVYLDVWERHITFLDDDYLREAALGGPDTATRSTVAWLVRIWPWDDKESNLSKPSELDRDDIDANWKEWILFLDRAPNGLLKAQAKVNASPKKIEPCAISPEARYSGPENRLYRVEIHTGGKIGSATFKWSRDNGSMVYSIIRFVPGKDHFIGAALEYLGAGDNRRVVKEGDWVEIYDDQTILKNEVLQNEAEPLLQVMDFNKNDKVVYLDAGSSTETLQKKKSILFLRKWDHRAGDPKKGGLDIGDDGAALIEEDKWLNLEDGIQIWFSPPEKNKENFYRTGDYWLIPARTATGNVQWPQDASGPSAIQPHGVEHHYAPLKIFGESEITDCRRKIDKLWV